MNRTTTFFAALPLGGILCACGAVDSHHSSKRTSAPTDVGNGNQSDEDARHLATEDADLRIAAPKVTERTLSYTGADGRTYEAVVYTPVAAGTYPLFLWVPGTNEVHNAPVALHIAKTMAEKGVIAATVAYNNKFVGPWTCESYDARARALLDLGRTTSFISALKRTAPSLDLKKGIALGGHSLGAWIAGRGLDVSPDVRAAWLLGAGTSAFGVMELCLRAKQTKLVNVRVINGEHDGVYGGTAASNREQAQLVTGVAVDSTADSSFGRTGVGYALVHDADLPSNGIAEHFYFISRRCGDALSCTPAMAQPQPEWDKTTAAWGRQANQTWLLGHLTWGPAL